MKKIHVVTFAYEETGLGRVAETFGMAEDRIVSLANDLVNRIVGAAKGVSVENPGSISIAAMVMDFVEDLEAEECGPVLVALTVHVNFPSDGESIEGIDKGGKA